MDAKDLLLKELILDKYVRGKALRHSYVHLRVGHSNELNQFCAPVALAELRF